MTKPDTKLLQERYENKNAIKDEQLADMKFKLICCKMGLSYSFSGVNIHTKEFYGFLGHF